MARVSTPLLARAAGQRDRCPGVLAPHPAADGAMVRIRVPGGQTTGTALRALGRVAQTYGSGLVQLTSRGSLQLRGLPEVLPSRIADDVATGGFLPSAAHERVRNVAASPWTGLSGGDADLRPMVAALDDALLAEPALADLPGRFLFVLDDGRGDVRGLALDLGYLALGPGHGWVLVGDDRHCVAVTAAEAVPTLIALAHRFLARRGDAWHVRELAAPLVDDLSTAPASASPDRQPLGAVGEHLGVSVPLGLLSPAQLDAVTDAVGDGPLVITPWRGLVLPGAASARSAVERVGLVTDDDSAWTLVTACVGAPWCASGRADTRTLAARLAGAGGPSAPTHLSGCERRCGAPATAHVDLVAPAVAEVDALVGAARG